MVPHAGCGRKNLLPLLLLISLATITTQAKADFTPPSLTTWIGSGETTGIFTTGKITYNITSGEQPHPTITQIALRSNTSQPINLGTCVADFRLVRLEANDTLTTTDYAYHTISSINAINGVFWASMIHDYPSTYKFGLVIWNVSDGSVVGRLVATIEATSEPLVKLTTDKTEYTPSDTIHYTMVNCGPQVMTSSMCFVYRQVGGGWVLVNKLGSADFPQKRIVVSKEKPYLGKISSSYADLSQSGVYKVVKGYAASVPGENGQASAEFRINSTSIIFPFREYSVLVWSLLGGASGLLLYYMIRRAKGYPRASGDSVEVTPIIYNRLQDSRTQKRLGIIFVIVLILGYISPCPQIPPT
jgi:hypothetical protein